MPFQLTKKSTQDSKTLPQGLGTSQDTQFAIPTFFFLPGFLLLPQQSLTDPPTCAPSYLDVGGINVTCVILFGRYQLYPVLLIRDNFADAAALSIFWQSSCAENTIRFFLWNLLILCEHHSLFQLLLQGSELQQKLIFSSLNYPKTVTNPPDFFKCSP